MRDPRWLLALLLLAVWATIAGHALLSLCTSLSLLTALSIGLSRRFCLRGVDYQRSLGQQRVQQGETVELTASFGNRKLMPVALLEIEDTLPRHVSVSGASVRATRAELLPCLYIARAMLPYERVTRRMRVRCDRRGVHHFGPASVRAGDYLGAPSQHLTIADTQKLLVLPKVFPLALDKLTSRQLIGSTAARRDWPPDPLFTVGSRDYRPGDPLRSVDWRASARRSSLMVREFEPSTTPALQLVLNFRIAEPHGDRIEPDELEFAISVTASLAAHASRQGWRVGLCGNGWSASAPLAVRASSAPSQLAHVLEALAYAGPRPSGTLVDWLRAQPDLASVRGSLVLVTEQLDAAALRALTDLQRRGRALTVVLTASADRTPALGGLPVLRIPYREGWAQHESLAFVA